MTPVITQNICVINAEPAFLPHLRKLHAHFPRLRIVLEHATTRAAVDCVKALGNTVACTITAHHIALTVDDWAGQGWNFCKPVAKFPDDRQALRDVIAEGMQFARCWLVFFYDAWESQVTLASSLDRTQHRTPRTTNPSVRQTSRVLLAYTHHPSSSHSVHTSSSPSALSTCLKTLSAGTVGGSIDELPVPTPPRLY